MLIHFYRVSYKVVSATFLLQCLAFLLFLFLSIVQQLAWQLAAFVASQNLNSLAKWMASRTWHSAGAIVCLAFLPCHNNFVLIFVVCFVFMAIFSVQNNLLKCCRECCWMQLHCSTCLCAVLVVSRYLANCLYCWLCSTEIDYPIAQWLT